MGCCISKEDQSMNLNLNPNSSLNRQNRLEEYQDLTKTKKSVNLPFNYNTNEEKDDEIEPSKSSFIYKNTGFFGGVSVSDKAITPIKERTVSDINVEKFVIQENDREETENENLVNNRDNDFNKDKDIENREKSSFISKNNCSIFNNNKNNELKEPNYYNSSNVENKFIKPHLTPSNNKNNRENTKNISSDIFLPYNTYQSNNKDQNINSRSLNFNNISNNESNIKTNSDNKMDFNNYSLYNQNLDTNENKNINNPVEVKVSFKNLNTFNDDLSTSDIQFKKSKNFQNQTYENNVISSKSIDYNLQNTSRIRFNTTIIKDKDNKNYKDLKRNFPTKRNNDLNTNLALEKVYEEQNKIQEFLFNYNNLNYNNNHTQSLTNLGIDITTFSNPGSRLDSKYNESRLESDKGNIVIENEKKDLNLKFDNFTSRNLLDKNNVEYAEKSYDKVKSSKALGNLRSIFDSTKSNSIVNKFRNKKNDEQNNLNNLVKYQHIFSDSNFDNKNSTIFQTNLSNAEK